MNNLKTYESLWLPSERKNWEEQEEKEALEEILEQISPEISKFLTQKGLEIEIIETEDSENFILEYTTKDLAGRIPNMISLYMDELCKMISKDLLGTKIDWQFSPNGRVDRVEFSLPDGPIDPKIIKVIKTVRHIF